MKIKYLGHACFKIVTNAGFEIIIDPYKDNSVPGYSELRERTNIVITSHRHDDHSGTECVEIAETTLEKPIITAIHCWHDDQQGALRGANNINIIEADGQRIAHLGDLGHALTDEMISELRNLDALMIPVGGRYTIDAKLAYEIAQQTKPKLLAPMHFRDGELGYDELATGDEFFELCNQRTTSYSGDFIELDDYSGVLDVRGFSKFSSK